jgi:uncharacterized protein YprB with RNaseH-like and TPR domain
MRESLTDQSLRRKAGGAFLPASRRRSLQRRRHEGTEWSTRDYSIKTLAKYLGFEWRDAHPSGAASIELYDRWAETGDPAIKQRILDYNEDHCRATRVLLDGIGALS